MRTIQQAVALLLCALIPVALFGSDEGYKVAYDGGSIHDVKTGTDLKLYIDTAQIRLVKGKADVVTITEISYGQDFHRRVGAAIGVAIVSLGIGALLALTKSKKHYVGLT